MEKLACIHGVGLDTPCHPCMENGFKIHQDLRDSQEDKICHVIEKIMLATDAWVKDNYTDKELLKHVKVATENLEELINPKENNGNVSHS